MASALERVVAPTHRSAFQFVVAVAAIVGGFFVAQDRAAAFVDERVRAKTLASDKVMEAQMQRLEKLDSRLDAVQGNVNDIKIDIARVRALLEKK